MLIKTGYPNHHCGHDFLSSNLMNYSMSFTNGLPALRKAVMKYM